MASKRWYSVVAVTWSLPGTLTVWCCTWRSGVVPGSRCGKMTRYWCWRRSEEHTSELQSRPHLVCRLLLEKKNIISDYFSLDDFERVLGVGNDQLVQNDTR